MKGESDRTSLPWQMEQALNSQGKIVVRGARTHNLQSVDLVIPRKSLTVITGVSGSGKSSFAFHSLFAEGQRRFLGTIAGRSRAYLDQLPRPEVDSVEGLPPVISVSQQRGKQNSRSTVATLTEIHDYLRLLFARLGEIYCPKCQVPVTAVSPERIVSQLLEQPERTKMMLLAPMIVGKKGEHRAVFEQIFKDGYVRARVDGEINDISDVPELNKNKSHTIEAVVDRLILKPDIRSRLADSVDHALRLGDGMCIAVLQQNGVWTDRLFHRDHTCKSCNESFPSLEPRTFSWHNPHGACPRCEGTGRLDGDAAAQSEQETDQTPESLNACLCPECQGTRLNRLARHVKTNGVLLPELLRFSLAKAKQWLIALPDAFEENIDQLMASKLVEPLSSRFDFLDAVGVGYLSLDRSAETLSGGELQRVRLARCLGTQLQGGCFILDEPTAGLHQQDTARLLKIFREMVQQGNTVICVEHDFDVIREADYILEFGPEGGKLGGKLLFSGTPEELKAVNNTATGLYLNDPSLETGSQAKRSQAVLETSFITLDEVTLHNLQNVSIKIPCGLITCLSGVSGSGKSTLILDALAPLMKQLLASNRYRKRGVEPLREITEPELGILRCEQQIEKLLVVDQTPPGKSARSCPATFSGAWDHVRNLLAQTKLAKIRGYGASRFSFNSTKGTCDQCKGQGKVRLKMNYLPDAFTTCPGCLGKRFNSQTLAVRFKGYSASDLLEMTIDQALEIWSEVTTITQRLEPLQQIGLGYLCLGQPASSLSGGEAQRMKLAREMSLELKNSLLILDEPTSGLHAADISKLLDSLLAIQEKGNTIIIIEHNPMLLACAHWKIELGPGAGLQGGNVLHCA